MVPWAGAASDRSASRYGRLPLVVAGLLLSSVGMALIPWAGAAGLTGLVAALTVLVAATR